MQRRSNTKGIAESEYSVLEHKTRRFFMPSHVGTAFLLPFYILQRLNVALVLHFTMGRYTVGCKVKAKEKHGRPGAAPQ